MVHYRRNNNDRFTVAIWQWWLIILISNSTRCQQLYQSVTVFSSSGTQFLPVNAPAQMLASSFTGSLQTCAITCNNNILCRVFDFDVIQSQLCRLFEGDIGTMGAILPSSSSTSRAGIIQFSPALFAEYGLPCSSTCIQSRYLMCINQTCQCTPHTYWDESVSMCLAQSPVLGAPCQQNMSMCREDLNYTCLQFNQCGPLSVLSGTTIADNNSVIVGSSTVGVGQCTGINIYLIAGVESVIIASYYQNLIISIWNSSSNNNYNISLVANNLTAGGSLTLPNGVFVDAKHGNNLYVSNSGNSQILLFSAMQVVSPLSRVVAGAAGIGSQTNMLNNPRGFAIDNQSNLIISDMMNHRVMFWKANATNGTMIAGLGIASSNSMGLNYPHGLFLDEPNSWLYVADTSNHRIQRFLLGNVSSPNGTTVAGGNGQGSANNQLNLPYDVWVSSTTGTVYIVDNSNNRLQRWSPGASTGVTIAGDQNGNSGTIATMLYHPSGFAINANETRMYVTDTLNMRIQRFELI